MGDWIETHKGIRINPLDPKPELFDIEDIAHSLSMQCRFNGHCSRFYSVAEHSVATAQCLKSWGRDGIFALWGLLHDGSEAYMGDLPRPLKRQLAAYLEHEAVLQAMIFAKFAGRAPSAAESAVVTEADNAMLVTEANALTDGRARRWDLPYEPCGVEIMCLSPSAAEASFLAEFAELINGWDGVE